MNRSRTHLKFIFISVAVLLTPLLGRAQEKVDVEKLRPKRVIDKVEVLAGPSISFTNGKDMIGGMNPRITTDYSSKAGYFVGVGLIHSLGKVELRARVLWEQRGSVQKVFDNEPKGLFLILNETKYNYLTIGFTPTIFIGRNQKFYVFAGASYSKLSSAESVQTLTLNDQIQSVYRIQYSAGQAGIKSDMVDVISGVGYRVYSKNKKEISAFLQNDYDITDVVNENGTVMRNNTLRVGVHLKIFR
jgi:hypothetical protein